MKKIHTLRDLGQIKVLSDPLRLRVLEAFCQEPRTTKQVAQLLHEKQPTRLYRHVATLERVGLIRLVKTRKNRGTIEKYYRAVAWEFVVDRRLFRVHPGVSDALGAMHMTAARIFDDTLAEMQASLASKLTEPQGRHGPLALTRHHIRATRSEIERLAQVLHEWIEECRTAEGRVSAAKVEYGLTVAFYPITTKKKTDKRTPQTLRGLDSDRLATPTGEDSRATRGNRKKSKEE
jgi:DNA-binding transcriptional ArsR family regulator